MTKLIAIHALHLASAVPGQIEVIEPGQAFIAREDELGLNDRGATRLATAEDKGAKQVVRAGATSGNAAPAAGSEDISKMNKAQLIALAAAEEIAIDDKAAKDVIVETIVAGRKAKDEEAI